jgi:RNA polymerase sigma-70 factor (ECF subfamily)
MGSVLAYARRRTDEASARDVAAETFTIMWRRWAELEQPDLPRLYRTAGLVLKNQERASRRRLAAQPEQVTTDAMMTPFQ